MKSKSFTANGYSQIFFRRAHLAATILAASALVFVQPVFAQSNVGSDPGDPLPWGSVTVANPPDPFEVPGNAPSSDAPALASAPMQRMQPESPLVTVPPAPDGYDSNGDNPPPWGSTEVHNQDNYGDFNPYAVGEPGGYTTPMYDGSALGSAPEAPMQPAQPESSQGYVPPAPTGLVESFGRPPINPSFPELPPSALSRPGTFQNTIR